MKKSLVLKQLSKVGITTVFCFAAAAAFAQDAEIKNAELLVEHGKQKQAIEVLKKAVAQYPAATQLNYILGHTQLVAGDKAGAKATFDQGATANPKEPLNFAGQGHILTLGKKSAEAKPLLEKALGMGKKNILNLRAIAEAYMADKATSKAALPLLQKAKEIDANDYKTALLLGDYFLLENQGGSSASAYEDAAALNSSSGMPHYKHAVLFMRTKNVPVVEEDLKKAIAADPDFALAHQELGELYYLKKDGANAVKHYEIYLKLADSPSNDDDFKMAFFYFMAKNYAKANDMFKVLSQKPDVTPMTLRFYAKALTESGNYPEAQKVFEGYMSTKKDSIKAVDYNNYADLFLKQGKDSLWAVNLEKSVALEKNQVKVLETLQKYYYTDKKRYSASVAICRTLIKVRKPQPMAADYLALGRSLYFNHQYTVADSAFAKLIEMQPKITLGYTWAARSKSAQDTLLTDGLAKPFYEKVIEIGETDKEKNKTDLGYAYQYMGSYHMIKQENQIALGYWDKILAIKPDDPNALEAIKLIKTAAQVPPKKKK